MFRGNCLDFLEQRPAGRVGRERVNHWLNFAVQRPNLVGAGPEESNTLEAELVCGERFVIDGIAGRLDRLP